MRIRLFIFISFISILGCGQKSMSPEDFKKAKWINHSKGIDYISSEKGNLINPDKDSFDLKLRAISTDGINIQEVNPDEDTREAELFVLSLINKLPSGISSGYLRLNATEMAKPDFPEMVVFLIDAYDSVASFRIDSMSLIKIPGIKTISFISKNAAKEILFGNENHDWDNILDTNPILPYFKVNLEQREWTRKEMEDIKSILSKTIPSATEIDYPRILLEQKNSYTIFEFRRKQSKL